MRAALHPTGLYLALRAIPASELQDPFMQGTIARVPAAETIFHVERGQLGQNIGKAPAGLVFHVARCGSTLISQSLKKLGAVTVYAEPQPMNELLLPPHKWPRQELILALRALGSAFARHAATPYVLKFSSWNTLFCDLLAEAFPESPWILSYRDPIEVGVSMLRDPPGWMRESEPARQLAHAMDPTASPTTTEEYIARIYGAYCERIARLDLSRGKLVAYETLPAAVYDVVAPHFRLAVTAEHKTRIADAARIDAKAPLDRPSQFKPDAATKQAGATASLRDAIDTFARPALERLMKRHHT